jgi:2-polyprenyl-6-methoxyphenol hydroxylase-like FAD-dependent oxidoreductase
VTTDVIVVGAGPTGLLLAGELALGGATVTVRERLERRTGQSKALNLQPRSAEVLDSRGLLEPILAEALDRIPAGHFAGLPLDYSGLATRYPYQIGIPQARVEDHLETWARSLGVRIVYGSPVADLTQDEDGVTAGGERAAFVVGCDGGRSTVRKLLNVPFPGRDARMCAVVADVTLSGGGPEGWRLPDLTPRDGGVVTVLPLAGDVFRVLAAGPEQLAAEQSAPVTEAELARVLDRADLTLGEVRWASRFTDVSRQAARYRSGRVLLAGDAAHVHSPTGGQGLNLGLQDAFNLGWKLAAVLRGDAPDALLDSYHDERHPVGARVLASTRAQGVLMVPDGDVVALRGIVASMMDATALAEMVAGLDIVYPTGCPHPLAGRRMPGLDLAVLRDGRAHLVETGGDTALVRPDGYVAWAVPTGSLSRSSPAGVARKPARSR